MKRTFLFRALLITGLVCNAVHAEVDIYKIFQGLTNTFDILSAKNGLLADLDEVLANASRFRAFSGCQARSLATRKPYQLIVQVIKKTGKPDIRINCGDYSIPLESIKFMLDLIKNKIIGSAENPGLLSSIIQVLEGAGIDVTKEITDSLVEIQASLKAFEEVLDWLIKSLKVDPNAKAILSISNTDANSTEKNQTGPLPTVKKQNFYEILEIASTATLVEIKKAYRRLALKYHPDKNAGDTEAEEQFKALAEAYATLADVATRKAYNVAIKSGQ